MTNYNDENLADDMLKHLQFERAELKEKINANKGELSALNHDQTYLNKRKDRIDTMITRIRSLSF